jgi:hypothetical protein
MEGGGEWSIPQGILSQVITKLDLLADRGYELYASGEFPAQAL